MKISKLFQLGKTQCELDFVDIDPSVDTPLFLDPYFISKCEFPFAERAHYSLQTYFEQLLWLLRGGFVNEASELFSHLGESNDVCMGMSTGKPRGHGIGPDDTTAIFKSLRQSRAMQTGIMEDIEDFRIFVPNVDKDKVSDMTANIIKWQLIQYTIEQCELHNIPLIDSVPSGMYWDAERKLWDNQYARRLVVDNRPILLVPKRIVSYTDKYTSYEYRQHFVLNFLQHENLQLQTSLVQKRVDGSEYVTKKSIVDTSDAMDKDFLVAFTQQHPEVFADFKYKTKSKISEVDGAVFDQIDAVELCDHLKKKLRDTPSGSNYASAYHSLVVGILELLLYPNLSNPRKETPIHEGRKRIDIRYDNSAEHGFFFDLPTKNPSLTCFYVFVECKNYTGEVKNPELDQLSGRFSPRRGRVGILTCRNLDSKDGFMKRCADTFHDDRGLIIPLCDDDLIQALDQYPLLSADALETLLVKKFEQIVFQK